MRAYLIIIFQARQQYVTEVPLSEHNKLVKTFASDRTDQPVGISILPRGAWRRWSVANAHRSKSSDEDIAIGPIAIADQIVESPFPAESFRNLICNPFCGRMRGGAPHSGLAMLISWISLRMSGGTVGRPLRRLDFQRQYALKPARCQRMTVSGLTIANASQALGNNR